MRSYKVEIIETQKYVLDIQAESEAEAEKKAYAKYQELEESNIKHYHEYGDLEAEVGQVYDVTGTDDDAFLASTGGGCKEGLCVNCGKDITGNRNGQCPFCWDKK